MDLHSNLEYLCRVCAANTKGKGNSVAECAYILKTPGLKDKLDKFLYLKIADNDSLPKVLCKSCFRQVEATASLSKIAKHTQQVFRDFLLSNLPKSSSDPVNTSEVISSDFLGNKDSEKSQNERSVPPAPASTRTQLPLSYPPLPPPPVPPQTHIITASSPRKDEVIVNVSVSDPLTRDNQLKMISNSQRRQSLLIEPRYTPKSIAQNIMAPPSRPVLIKPVMVETIPTASTTNNHKTTTTPLLNFYPFNKALQQQHLQQQQQHQQQQQQQQQEQQQHQQQQQQEQQKQQQQRQQHQQEQQSLQAKQNQPSPAQVTTFTSGGYVIGRLNTVPTDKEEPKKTTLPLTPAADNVLQQKRKNLVKALNNIKANNSGQVSLLKSSQQKQISLLLPNVGTKTPLAEVVNQAAEDELPDKIIIAAPKKKSPEKSKKEPLNLTSNLTAPKPKPVAHQTVTTTVITQEPPAPYNPPPPPKPTFPEDILLGRVIRDMDLLKLILKALQWPVNKQNIELQLQRLKNSKFTDIMSDSNLLQDTDLTQLLGPYLAPVLLAAQALQQQQHQLLKNTTLNQNMSAAFITQKSPPTLDPQAEINKSMPYKLPPETSVQLVPATPEEQEQTSKSPPLTTTTTSSSSSTSLKRKKRNKQKEPKPIQAPPKRQRRAAAQKARESIVILSDEDDDEDDRPLKKPASKQKTSKPSTKIQIESNSNFMPQLGVLNGSGGDEANEALLALLNRQKAAISKQQQISQRRRNSISNMITLPASEFDSLIDLDDDIVLMEPVTTTSASISSSDSLTASSGQQQQQLPQIDLNSFIVPPMPLITRPIIKRRKTVIQTNRPSYNLTMDLLGKDSFLNMEQPSTQIPSNNVNVVSQLPSNVENPQNKNEATKSTSTGLLTKSTLSTSESSLLSNPLILPTKPSTTKHQKKLQNKSALGQQLLEAIGLQTLPSNYLKTATELATTSSNIPIKANLHNTNKQSIKQIRSALKKSLKQAQEQQQQRKKELSSTNISNTTIIQDADSTTKSTVKEIVVVEGKGNKSDNCSSSLVDVEDQIDKVTLMVRGKSDKEKSFETTIAASVMTLDREEKQDDKKFAQSKIPDRRRTSYVINRGGRSNVDSNLERSLNIINVVSDIKTIDLDNDKSEKEDIESLNISSSLAITMPISFADTMMSSSEMNQSKEEDAAPIPKKRGRKRIVDRLENSETAAETYNDKSKEEEEAMTEETPSNINTEEETTSNKTSSGRPTRQSKALSKYYKGPDKITPRRRSLPSRSTRNRKYS